MALTVDKEGRCAVYPASRSAGKIGTDARRVEVLRQGFAPLSHGEFLFFDKLRKKSRAQPVLVFKQQIVHLPKLPSGSGKLSGFGRRLGLRVHLAQGEIPEDKTQAFPKMLLQTFDNGIGAAAIGAFDSPHTPPKYMPHWGRLESGLPDQPELLVCS